MSGLVALEKQEPFRCFVYRKILSWNEKMRTERGRWEINGRKQAKETSYWNREF